MKTKMKPKTMTLFFTMLLGFAVMFIGTEQAHATIQQDQNGVYQIGSYEELKEFAYIVNGTHETITWSGEDAILIADIECTDEEWVPIGKSGKPYTGTFDGNGKVIKKLSNKYNDAADRQGLFGQVGSNAIVKDFGLEDVYIHGSDYIGGVAGENYGRITNCYNTGTVSGQQWVGGVAGENYGKITNCYNTGTVSGQQIVGGVAGINEGTITNCYNTGTVSGQKNVGGVVGKNEHDTEITNCYNTGTVSGKEVVGGVVGKNESGWNIINCYNTGNVSGQYEVGGVAGDNLGTITNCLYDRTVCTANAIGFGSSGTNVKGLTTAEMTGLDCTAYDSWDKFNDNWYLTKEYPLLGAFVYTAVWLDGDETTKLDTKEYLLGDKPTTEKIPTKKPESGNSYAFEKWDNGTLVGNTMTYKPIFAVADEWEDTITINGEEIKCILQDPNRTVPDDTYLKVTSVEQGTERWNELYGQLDDTSHIENVAFLDIDLLYEGSDEPVPMPLDKRARILLQILSGWDKNDMETVLVASFRDMEFEEEFVTRDGVDYVAFYTDHMGAYAMIDKLNENERTPDQKPMATPTAKATVKGKTSMTLSWAKVEGAEGYDIFFSRCNNKGKKITMKKVKTIEGNKIFSYTKKGLKKKTAYKASVKAYVMKDGKKTYIKTSPEMHAYTGGFTKKYTNAKAVTVNKTKVTLTQGKTFKVKAKVKKLKKNKKLMPKGHVAKIRYLSSDSSVATVSKSGKITAKGKGTCTIVAFAHNGVSKNIKITVE